MLRARNHVGRIGMLGLALAGVLGCEGSVSSGDSPGETATPADVLYETRDIAPLLAITARLLAPTGSLWLAEPGRDAARRFLAAATELGWQYTSETQDGPWADGTSVTVGLHFLRRPG